MRGPANQSLSPIEPVSVAPKRKLKNDEQRPGPEKRPSRARRLRIGAQRLRRASLTHRNVGASRTPGNRSAETGLAGWGGRIRTPKFQRRPNVRRSKAAPCGHQPPIRRSISGQMSHKIAHLWLDFPSTASMCGATQTRGGAHGSGTLETTIKGHLKEMRERLDHAASIARAA